jgi:hypothetical protein
VPAGTHHTSADAGTPAAASDGGASGPTALLVRNLIQEVASRKSYGLQDGEIKLQRWPYFCWPPEQARQTCIKRAWLFSYAVCTFCLSCNTRSWPRCLLMTLRYLWCLLWTCVQVLLPMLTHLRMPQPPSTGAGSCARSRACPRQPSSMRMQRASTASRYHQRHSTRHSWCSTRALVP